VIKCIDQHQYQHLSAGEINICLKVITRPQALCCWPSGNKKARAGFSRTRRKTKMTNGVSSGQPVRMTTQAKENQFFGEPPFWGGNSAPGWLNSGLLSGKAKSEKGTECLNGKVSYI